MLLKDGIKSTCLPTQYQSSSGSLVLTIAYNILALETYLVHSLEINRGFSTDTKTYTSNLI